MKPVVGFLNGREVAGGHWRRGNSVEEGFGGIREPGELARPDIAGRGVSDADVVDGEGERGKVDATEVIFGLAHEANTLGVVVGIEEHEEDGASDGGERAGAHEERKGIGGRGDAIDTSVQVERGRANMWNSTRCARERRSGQTRSASWMSLHYF